MSDIIKHSEYRNWLYDLKQQIKTEQIKASRSVNSQMIMLYWDLGKQITEKQENAKWGSGFIKQLSKDLREEFPEMKGFSADNLTYMKRFYLFYSQTSEKSVRQFPRVPWGHHMLILKKVKDYTQALFYINKTIENNWSRAILEYQIESNLSGRQGKAVTNFSLTLPTPQSDLANELMKDLNNPIGVSTFHYTELADDIKAVLPSAEELQNELLNFEREHGKR